MIDLCSVLTLKCGISDWNVNISVENVVEGEMLPPYGRFVNYSILSSGSRIRFFFSLETTFSAILFYFRQSPIKMLKQLPVHQILLPVSYLNSSSSRCWLKPDGSYLYIHDAGDGPVWGATHTNWFPPKSFFSLRNFWYFDPADLLLVWWILSWFSWILKKPVRETKRREDVWSEADGVFKDLI